MNAPLSIYQSPSERLASTVRRTTSPTSPTSPTLPTSPAPSAAVAVKEDPEDIQSSIRQVTSAIVHYVSENPASRTSPHPPEAGRSSPLPRCLWVESSFVGINSSESAARKRNPSLPPPHPPPRSLHPPHPHASSDLHNPSRPGELMLA